MQKSDRTSARREDNKDQSKDKKRRRLAEESIAPILQQQTISELFSTGQQKTSQTTKPFDPSEAPQLSKLAETPRSKRQKLRPSSPANERLPATSMYSFPARNKTNASNVIDLTDSPNASPSPRKPLKPARSNYNPNLGPKKIVVKNLRTVPRADPHQYLDQTWTKLAVSLDAIFCDKDIPYSMEELYKGAENVCRQGHSAELCGRLEQKAKTYAGILQKSLLQGIDSESTVVLQEVVNAWSTWSKQMVCVKKGL
jgi:cullin 4